MKKVLTKFLALSSISLLMLSACKKDGTLVTSNGGKPGALTASVTTLVLDKTKLTDSTSVINFKFTAPNYGYSAAVTNTLQLDAAGDNWAKPTSVTLGTKVLSQGYNTADFNALLLKLNLIGGTTAQIQVRVMHTISADVMPIYSNVVNVTVTPFNLAAWVYVPGAYQGWLPATADSLLSATSNGIYTGIINFTAGNNQFLITPGKTFDNKYATNDPTGNTSKTVTVNGPNNFYAPAAAGQYVVTLNVNTNTITFAQANYYSVIGSVTPGGDFSTDVDLKFVNSINQDWEGIVPMTAGQFKFRQNNDWTYSWGDIATPDGKDATNASGGNINVAAAGNYKVTFAIPITTVGNPPPVTATYTLAKQ
jgi:hypothetical protein